MLDWFIKGGVMMYAIAFASMAAVAIILERFSFYRRIETGTKGFLKELYDCLDVRQTEAAEDLCKRNPGPLSAIALSAIGASDRSREELKEVIEEAGSREMPALDSNLGLLATIAGISPLLGLLGTVLGMISAFQQFQEEATKGGTRGTELMAGGIWEALITTVAGLSVAIVSQIVHNYLTTRKDRIAREMEEASYEILEIVSAKSAR